MTPISEILVPMDFSPCSHAALEFAKRLAHACSARMHLLSVDDDPLLMHVDTAQSFRDEHEGKMAAKLRNVLSADEQQQFRSVVAVRCGTAANEIEDYATENRIDLIVMGVTGRSEFADIIMGSATQHALRHAPCPVVVVRGAKC